MNRGEIWQTNLRSVSRVIVIGVIPNHPNVIVVPLRDDLAVTPTLLAVRDPGTGLIADVAAMTGLSRTRLLEHVGNVDHKTMSAIGSGIAAFLDL